MENLKKKFIWKELKLKLKIEKENEEKEWIRKKRENNPIPNIYHALVIIWNFVYIPKKKENLSTFHTHIYIYSVYHGFCGSITMKIHSFISTHWISPFIEQLEYIKDQNTMLLNLVVAYSWYWKWKCRWPECKMYCMAGHYWSQLLKLKIRNSYWQFPIANCGNTIQLQFQFHLYPTTMLEFFTHAPYLWSPPPFTKFQVKNFEVSKKKHNIMLTNDQNSIA